MNSYIFECIRATANKFGVTMFYNCSQVNNILTVANAHFFLCKSIKIEFQSVFLKLVQLFLVYIRITDTLKFPENFIAMG